MQFPITIGLRRSFFLAGGAILVHALALLAIWVPAWTIAITIAGYGFIVVSALWSVRQWMSQEVALRLLADGRLECRFSGDEVFLPAELAAPATVHPWMTVIHVKTSNRKMTIVAMPDSGRADELRQLRIWLRWRAEFKADGGREE